MFFFPLEWSVYPILNPEKYNRDCKVQAHWLCYNKDFCTFAEAGRSLAELHVHYEQVQPYPLKEIHSDQWNPDRPDAYRVEKMKYAGKRPQLDRSTILYNAGITLTGIPAEAHEYRLGSRSAIDWLIKRYQVKTDRKSGITNDVNDWAVEINQPRYILKLIKRITTVSMKTVNIVKGLPELPYKNGTTGWLYTIPLINDRNFLV